MAYIEYVPESVEESRARKALRKQLRQERIDFKAAFWQRAQEALLPPANQANQQASSR